VRRVQLSARLFAGCSSARPIDDRAVGRNIGYIAFDTLGSPRPAGLTEGGEDALLDNLTVALCISIGTGVPWLIAVYSDNGARQLIGNTVFGMVGTVFAASAFNWIFSEYGIVALVTLGPAVAFLTIAAGQAAKRAVLSRLSRSPY
jgi:hypothetical protein